MVICIFNLGEILIFFLATRDFNFMGTILFIYFLLPFIFLQFPFPGFELIEFPFPGAAILREAVKQGTAKDEKPVTVFLQ